ncbi:dihydroxyacetone kinase phosphoryl donor subunit DhaM [Corynebacterium pseudotuberculosis]|uniref:Phosphocarrier protein HPr n=1 Tax=Corynebacterium pseudotuberculosis (strain C231) TaxID=681645 RepID=D9QAF5_CORP2|nr:dihydroxyacetone kinase phosphoryl donor subunit DhaM [Corynebacterium pseudotuberculosis]ADK28855.1 HPr family phosphocarrier protein [Corynebacterium pseudotuberculosis FRC41]ADL10531.1 HPr family phosphocarrier protein [Corynebacterium pseudotuberculosis C231]ADL20942.1 HPr family phosphocarrier protein [Corynebacterium pseudotuberculosis 1002]ADO26330.1 HPr family phosphocarrier protein [Corynebacterium pseudotuberculosis I19]AEK92392.1 Fructose-specific phosphotransferase enzyme IIA co
MSKQKVGLVLVSHSASLAEGLCELAQQMASDVCIVPAGGREDGGIGTSYELVERSVEELLNKKLEVLILTDLGSATMTVETLLDFYDDQSVAFVNVPFVEGAVAAATAAQQGDTLDKVIEAALSANTMFVPELVPELVTSAPEPIPSGEYGRQVTVVDTAGLHARPASLISEIASEAEGSIQVNGVDAASSLLLMSLGIRQGETVTVTGAPLDRTIIDAIADAIASGLD